MINLVRLGDATDHGRKVITASTTMGADGRFVARKGGEVWCPVRPEVLPNLILEGDDSMVDNGILIARQGHRATCGCRLLSSLI